MQPELRYEVLLFCTRDKLEHLQLLSRTLLDVIVARAKKLPLRPISWVRMRPGKGWIGIRYDHSVTDVIRFHLNEPGEIDGETAYGDPDYEASVMNGDFEDLYRRLQNVSIDSFEFDISENRFMQYWRAQDASNFTVKDIGFRLRADTDYGTLDYIVNFLHPTEFDSVSCSSPISKYALTGSQWTDLLKRDSFLSTVKTTSLTIWDDDTHPPPIVILSDTSYPQYELRFLTGDVVYWIDTFFDKLQSVSITWADNHDKQPKSRMPRLLSKPSETSVRPPRDVFALYRDVSDYSASECDMYSLTSTKSRKRMHVFKWTAEVPQRHATVHVVLCEVKDI